MQEAPGKERRRRFRWSLASMIVAIAVVALGLWVVRLVTSTKERVAWAILSKYGPNMDPTLDVNHYRIHELIQVGNDSWRIRFVRVEGQGRPSEMVGFSRQALDQARFNPWWSPPDLPPQPRPTTSPAPGNTKASPGTSVR